MTEARRVCNQLDNNKNPKKTHMARSTTEEDLEDGWCSSGDEGENGFLVYGVEEGLMKKKKMKREKQSISEIVIEGQQLRDPLVVLGSDIMLLILSCLDARSVALSLLVSCGWRNVASSDDIWSSKCKELWHGKAHLPRVAKVNGLSKLAAYSLSVMDGNHASNKGRPM